ncbi:MAG: ribosome recycling factor [Patescibacteria group bacterium]
MQNAILQELQTNYDKAIDYLKTELSGLRTGRASVALVDNITVENYGAKMPLKQVASLSTSDAKTIVVQPWDRSLLVSIEKAITLADKGFSISNDGILIRLVLPDMSADRRKEIIKVLHEKIEAARISIREIRDNARDQVVEVEKAKEIGEDEKFRLLEKIDETTTEYNNKIKVIGDNKETEIMTI